MIIKSKLRALAVIFGVHLIALLCLTATAVIVLQILTSTGLNGSTVDVKTTCYAIGMSFVVCGIPVFFGVMAISLASLVISRIRSWLISYLLAALIGGLIGFSIAHIFIVRGGTDHFAVSVQLIASLMGAILASLLSTMWRKLFFYKKQILHDD